MSGLQKQRGTRRIVSRGNIQKELARIGILPVVITREEVQAGDLFSTLKALRSISKRNHVWTNRYSLVLSFQGWDAEDKPLWQYPEVCAYFQQVHENWPFWLWFAHYKAYHPGLLTSLLLGPDLPLKQNSDGLWRIDVAGSFADRFYPLMDDLMRESVRLLQWSGRGSDISQRACTDNTIAWLRTFGLGDGIASESAAAPPSDTKISGGG